VLSAMQHSGARHCCYPVVKLASFLFILTAARTALCNTNNLCPGLGTVALRSEAIPILETDGDRRYTSALLKEETMSDQTKPTHTRIASQPPSLPPPTMIESVTTTPPIAPIPIQHTSCHPLPCCLLAPIPHFPVRSSPACHEHIQDCSWSALPAVVVCG